jgi:hypothetical protein
MRGWISKQGSLLVLIFLSACMAENLTMGLPTNGNPSLSSSKINYPSITPTEAVDVSTPTLINTVVALPSPTEGPTPDLELLNLLLRYRGNGNGSLFGEIRNNTDSAMVFPINDNRQDIPILRFQTKAWDKKGIFAAFWNDEFSIGRGFDEGWHTSCFLYPGETGLFRMDGFGCQNELDTNCKAEHTFTEGIPEFTGIQLVGYQDLKTYIPWPDLYPGYHPQV